MDDLTALKAYHRSKDPEAFSHLVVTYQDMVYAVCRRLLPNRADAEDATQETFLKLARNAGAVRRNVAAWLHACARSTARDAVRRDATRRRHHHAAARQTQTRRREDQVGSNEMIARLDDALAALGDADRDLICAKYFVGRSQAELAQAHGVSQSLISRRLRQATERLHRQMGRLGCVAAPGALIPALESQATTITAPAAVQTALVKLSLCGAGPASTLSTGVSLMAISTQAKLAVAATAVALLIGGGVAVVKLRTPDPITLMAEALLEQDYGLSVSEDVRLLQTPYPEQRNTLLSNYVSSADMNDWVVAFEWQQGAGESDELRFKASTMFPNSRAGHHIYKNWIAENVLGLPWYSLGDHESLSLPMGDWIFRADLTPEQKKKGYASVLARRSGATVQLVRSEVRRDCVVWRGRPEAPVPTAPDETPAVLLTAAAPPFAPNARSQATEHSTSPESWFARIGFPFLDETDQSVSPGVMFSTMPDVGEIVPNDPRLRTKLAHVLQNLELQLVGGTFTVESRSFEVWTPVKQ